jgi:hypothetical protein
MNAMKEIPMTPKTETSSSESDRSPTALVSGVVHLALDVADRGQSTVIAVLQDARTELRSAVDGGLELAEKLATGALRFTRKVVQRADDTSKDALAGAERALAHAVTRARETARTATELATRTSRSQAA